MLKKTLLASIALISLSPVTAGQTMHTQHQQAPGNCPPCPTGGVQGWVLLPTGPGMPCIQSGGAAYGTNTHANTSAPTTAEMNATSSEEASPHHTTHHTASTPVTPKKLMHPEGRTPEQEKLEEELKNVTPHIFLRSNPNSTTPNQKEGEWGKELNGKVYFRHMGSWLHDASVMPADKVTTGVKDKVKALNATPSTSKTLGGSRPAASKAGASGPSAMKPATNTPEATATTTPPPPPPPAPTTSSTARKKWPAVTPPDVLGTTNRPNQIKTDPTKKGAPAVPDQGRVNRAQTNLEQRNAPQETNANQFIEPTATE